MIACRAGIAAGGAENAPMDWIRKSAAKGRYFPSEGAIRLVTAQALRRPPRAIPHPRVRVNVNSAPKRMHARAATVARTTAVAPHQSPTSLASRRRIAVAPPSRSLAQVRGRAGRSAALVTRAFEGAVEVRPIANFKLLALPFGFHDLWFSFTPHLFTSTLTKHPTQTHAVAGEQGVVGDVQGYGLPG